MRLFHAPLALLLTATLAACSAIQSPAGYAGNVYAMTNSASGNAIVHYGRGADGRLTPLDTTATGGNGIGSVNVANHDASIKSVDPLFSDNSVMLSPDHTRLFAVNAGSNTVSSFAVGQNGGLTLIGTVPSGGVTPTSLALSGSLLYVSHAQANAQGNQLSGFRVGADGALTAIAGASYAPSGKTIITQSLFSPSGQQLLVVELMTNKIDLYPVNPDGTLGAPKVNASAEAGPFGATFRNASTLLVSEVGPTGAKNAGSVSSYTLAADGTLTPVSPDVGNGQNATCWIKVTPDGQFAYAANTSSGSVSAYRIGASGALSLINGAAAMRAPNGATDFMGNPSSGPVDLVISADGKYLYQQWSGLGVVGAYSIGADGALTALPGGDGTGLPAVGSEGLAGY